MAADVVHDERNLAVSIASGSFVTDGDGRRARGALDSAAVDRAAGPGVAAA